jgi:hypothetical protein
MSTDTLKQIKPYQRWQTSDEEVMILNHLSGRVEIHYFQSGPAIPGNVENLAEATFRKQFTFVAEE